ncbi:MAG TPA: hypothetical protein DCL16_10765 [Acidimicrobiaceae bacterium]|nr:hypothetical protein [Acidimicrobiaceae bacterium]
MARKILTRCKWKQFPLLLAALISFGCGPDGPSVVRESDPSLLEPVATSIGTNESAELPQDKADVISENESSKRAAPTGGSATVLLGADPTAITGWTPWDHVCAWSCRNVLDQVLETLTVVLPDGSTAPWLAEQVEPNPTMLNWTITLRKGLRFSDDQPVTAQGIKEGYEEFLKKGEVTRGLLRDARINAVTVIDEHRFMIDLAEPNPSLDVVLAGPIGRVFSVEAAMADPSGFLRSPVGTGPFTMEPWELGQSIRLLANDGYWRTGPDDKPLPYLDELVFREIRDEKERIELVQSQDADFAQSRSTLAISRARDLELTVVSRNEDNVGVVLFNTVQSPVDDVRVRTALQLSTNQETLIKASLGAGAGEPATQWFAPESRWWSGLAAEAWPDLDEAAAEELLVDYINDKDRSDGRPPGSKISIDLQCTDDIHLSSMIRELSRQWEATGFVEVETETVTRSGLIQRVLGSITDRPGFSGDFVATCWRVGGESDPAMMFGPLFGPIRTSPLNVSNLHNESLTGFVDLLHSSANETVRQTAVEQIMLTLAEHMPMIYLSHSQSAVIGHPNTEGLGYWQLPNGEDVYGQVSGVGRWSDVWISDE